jgi:hypothetical protein
VRKATQTIKNSRNRSTGSFTVKLKMSNNHEKVKGRLKKRETLSPVPLQVFEVLAAPHELDAVSTFKLNHLPPHSEILSFTPPTPLRI